MLSRVADSLYWMARSIERADNLARIMQVNLDLLLDARAATPEQTMDHWLPVIMTTGDESDFKARFPQSDAQAVTYFLTLDPLNPNGILASLRNARENARTVRDQMSEEMWEAINELHLFLADADAARQLELRPSDFFARVLRLSYLIEGIAAASLSRDEGWLFYQLGRNLERADKTTRMLDICSHLPFDTTKQNAAQALRWVALLRSASAYNACQRASGGRLDPTRITEFLLFSDSFPRSVLYCIREFDEVLRSISGTTRRPYSNSAEQASGKLMAEIAFGSLDEVLKVGLHEYLDQLQTRFNELGQRVFENFIYLPDNTVPVTAPANAWLASANDPTSFAFAQAQQMQQQQ